ncbi:hydroxymethylpyrimidine/phosphomethylpyrimidine kinase [Mesorhizobium amorphae]|uniref:hydroxymethylpyrimidine/phosphomethylpyrimidine kinase n=1 Tax=Mesorhizobium amorphae TaxID=71433 RepID=UPI00235CA08A|nr:hydroxymethylpyrimidine/phosphomethylpyrimidine kinase [Mesorhizobium amorphae]GLR45922.1 hydroxymethylpyrimidine/phosphomethylpyrimidine kinase [Mesorhizobium amorphae]
MALKRDPYVLVVGGSDSSGGAGIARDIETIASIGVRTCLAVTAVTVQTHEAVTAIHHLQPSLVADQMRAALQANDVAAIKIGMLATAEIIVAVAAVLHENRHVPTVLDPVLASTSGRALLEAGAIAVMKRNLMPLCCLVTPNLLELAFLVGAEHATNESDAVRQGQTLLAAGLKALLIKGGHASGPRSTDVLVRADQDPLRFGTPRLARKMRGTGCVLASAIAAYQATGESMEIAVRQAKLLVFEKIRKTRTGGLLRNVN